jgi:mono/diheme cytochrome c family protein
MALSLTIGSRMAAAQAPDGQALYRQHCKTCHGATGTPTARMVGLYPKLKTLSDSALMAGLSVEAIVRLLQKGEGDMKALADKLTADQMTAVAQYVKTLPSVAHKP